MKAKLLMAGAPILLAACASTAEAPPAQVSDPMADPLITSGDPLTSAAALLIAAEGAQDAAARAPMIERLNALSVKPAEDMADDPLAAWRAQHAPYAGIPYRGRTLGPAYRRARLAAGETLEIAQVFYAGKRAEMRAQANGSDVALAISNPRAEAVCQARLTPQASCRWLPMFTERFAITLENQGDRAASVYLVFE